MTAQPITGQRALVTGGAGTIGSAVGDQLVEAGASEIVVLDNFVRGRRENLAAALESGLPLEHGPERKVNGVTRRLADISAAATDLGWKPEIGLDGGRATSSRGGAPRSRTPDGRKLSTLDAVNARRRPMCPVSQWFRTSRTRSCQRCRKLFTHPV
jgi:nucleoside-diphosphate-sugar epimerase